MRQQRQPVAAAPSQLDPRHCQVPHFVLTRGSGDPHSALRAVRRLNLFVAFMLGLILAKFFGNQMPFRPQTECPSGPKPNALPAPREVLFPWWYTGQQRNISRLYEELKAKAAM